MSKIAEERKYFRPDRMKHLREEMGWTQAECGERAGIGAARWNDIEGGRYDNLSLGTFAAICRALDVESTDELLVPFKLTGPAVAPRGKPKGGPKGRKAATIV